MLNVVEVVTRLGNKQRNVVVLLFFDSERMVYVFCSQRGNVSFVFTVGSFGGRSGCIGGH